MPSFQEAYSERDVWDVAFFLMTLRPGFEAVRLPGGTQIGLPELATSTNAELLAGLRRTRPDAYPGEVDYLRSNGLPVSAPTSGGALSVQEAFAAVTARVLPMVVGVSGYVNDPAWSPEKLKAEKGAGWIAANAESRRFPGFRPVSTGSGFIVDPAGYVLSSSRLAFLDSV